MVGWVSHARSEARADSQGPERAAWSATGRAAIRRPASVISGTDAAILKFSCRWWATTDSGNAASVLKLFCRWRRSSPATVRWNQLAGRWSRTEALTERCCCTPMPRKERRRPKRLESKASHSSFDCPIAAGIQPAPQRSAPRLRAFAVLIQPPLRVFVGPPPRAAPVRVPALL